MAKTNTHRSQWRGAGIGLFASLLLVAIVVSPAARAAEPCPNEAIRAGQVSDELPAGTTSFPDCMALELASPAKKFNQYAKRPGFSADGERVKFVSVAALAETPKQATIFDRYVATRTASGWTTQATAVPPEYTVGYEAGGVPCAFSADLSRWATFASTETQYKLSVTTAFQGGLGLPTTTLSPTLTPINELGKEQTAISNGVCEGASADISRFFFLIGAGIAYLPGDPLTAGSDDSDVYEAYRDPNGTPSVALLTRDKDGAVVGGRCGARIGGNSGRGAVSPDAGRIYFSTRPSQVEGPVCDPAANKLRIMLRTQTPAGPTIAPLVASECDRVSPPCSSADGDDVFQGASQEGERVLFTTTRQLANPDKDTTNDLYLHDGSRPAGERLTQLSAGEDASPGEGAEVLGVPDFGGDGSHLYFVAKGALTTTANGQGKTPEAGKPNLYLYEYPSEEISFVGTLDATDAATLGEKELEGLWQSGPGQNKAMAVPTLGADPEDQSLGGDGHVLVFESRAALTTDDTDGGKADVYRYDSTDGSLQRLSAAAPGGADNGPFAAASLFYPNREAGPQALTFRRWVSEDGESVVFGTKEALDPADTNGTSDAYLWREGKLQAIPFGEVPTVSMAGNEIAFISDQKLLPEDGDGANDIYLLRVNGGFAPPSPPAPCGGEACQGAPAVQPLNQGVASEAPRAGNPPQPTPRCKKGAVRKRGKCVSKKQKKQQRKQTKKRASHDRGGSK